MDTLKKQIMEINQLCNESDGLYHDIAQSYGLSDSIYWILMTVLFRKQSCAVTGITQSRPSILRFQP